MCGGGGGSSGVQKFEWNEDMKPYWRYQIEKGRLQSDEPYERYGGQRIAGLNSDQQAAMQAIRQFSGTSGSPVTWAANGQLQQTLQDDYLRGEKSNPFVQTSLYEGENPYFEDVVSRGANKIADVYNKTTAGNIARFKGSNRNSSAYQEATERSNQALAEGLSDFNTQMRSGQYDRSANLHENYLNRGMGAYEGERGRQLGAVSGGQNEQALAFERFRQLMGVGDIQRGLSQDQLNLGYQDWQEEQNYPYKMSDWFSGLLSRAQGGVSPNMTTTQSGYQANPFSQIIGAGMLGKGMGFY